MSSVTRMYDDGEPFEDRRGDEPEGMLREALEIVRQLQVPYARRVECQQRREAIPRAAQRDSLSNPEN